MPCAARTRLSRPPAVAEVAPRTWATGHRGGGWHWLPRGRGGRVGDRRPTPFTRQRRPSTLENSTATAAGLAALILAFGSVSGAHFNPVVTIADRIFGGVTTGVAIAYIAAQITGGCAGTITANLMFDLPAVTASTQLDRRAHCGSAKSWPPSGCCTVILGVVRAGRTALAPFAVAGYIAAAYWFTSSTSFANPAVTIARTLTDTFAGIKPSSAPMFIVAELVGGLLAVGLAVYLFPRLSADNVVVPHEHEDLV